VCTFCSRHLSFSSRFGVRLLRVSAGAVWLFAHAAALRSRRWRDTRQRPLHVVALDSLATNRFLHRMQRLKCNVFRATLLPKTTTADSNRAVFCASPNLSRPGTNVGAPLVQYSRHHCVPVDAGTKHTTVAPASADSQAFRMNCRCCRDYRAGYTRQRQSSLSLRASSSGVK
jgi:hypothetical protein